MSQQTSHDADVEATENGAGAEIPTLERYVEGGKAVVRIAFSQYELANMGAMFRAILPGRFKAYEAGVGHTPHPFDAFNTGDWTAVVADAFDNAATQYVEHYNPGAGARDIRNNGKAEWRNPEIGELRAQLKEAQGELDIRRTAMNGPWLRYAHPMAFCPQCGGEMRWTAETILRCERDISHCVAIAGPYSNDAQVVQNPPPIRHPETATAEMLTALEALRASSAAQHEDGIGNTSQRGGQHRDEGISITHERKDTPDVKQAFADARQRVAHLVAETYKVDNPGLRLDGARRPETDNRSANLDGRVAESDDLGARLRLEREVGEARDALGAVQKILQQLASQTRMASSDLDSEMDARREAAVDANNIAFQALYKRMPGTLPTPQHGHA